MKTNILLSTAIVAAGFMAIQPAQAGGFSMPRGMHMMMAPKGKPTFLGSSSFEGRTTTVLRRNDGAHIVNILDKAGARTEVRQRMPAGISVDDGKGGWKPWTPKPKSDEIGSTDRDGVHISVRPTDVGLEITRRDRDGNTIRQDGHPRLGPGIYVDDGDGGWKKYTPKPRGRFPRVIGSSTFGGETRTVTLNADGTHTVTVTDADGNVISSETHAPGR